MLEPGFMLRDGLAVDPNSQPTLLQRSGHIHCLLAVVRVVGEEEVEIVRRGFGRLRFRKLDHLTGECADIEALAIRQLSSRGHEVRVYAPAHET